jgi:hypothetical protein
MPSPVTRRRESGDQRESDGVVALRTLRPSCSTTARARALSDAYASAALAGLDPSPPAAPVLFQSDRAIRLSACSLPEATEASAPRSFMLTWEGAHGYRATHMLLVDIVCMRLSTSRVVLFGHSWARHSACFVEIGDELLDRHRRSRDVAVKRLAGAALIPIHDREALLERRIEKPEEPRLAGTRPAMQQNQRRVGEVLGSDHHPLCRSPTWLPHP